MMHEITHNGETKSMRQWAGELGVNYGAVKWRWQQGIRRFETLFSGGSARNPLRLTPDDIEWLEYTRKARKGMRNEWEIACELVGLSPYRADELRQFMEGRV